MADPQSRLRMTLLPYWKILGTSFTLFFLLFLYVKGRRKAKKRGWIFRVRWQTVYGSEDIYLPNCLKVVWKLSVSEYILTFQTGEYCLSTALGRRGYSHTLNHLRTLNTFVETFFSPDSFGLTSSFFLSFVFSTNRIFSRINDLTIQTRTTVLQTSTRTQTR